MWLPVFIWTLLDCADSESFGTTFFLTAILDELQFPATLPQFFFAPYLMFAFAPGLELFPGAPGDPRTYGVDFQFKF